MKLFDSKNSGYVSKIDEFLSEFDKIHALSDSQRAEIKKYQRVDLLRDKIQIKPNL